MGHYISEIVSMFDIHLTMVYHVYWEYLMEGITAHSGQHHGWLWLLSDHELSHLAIISYLNRQTTLAQIISPIIAENTNCISSRLAWNSLTSMGYGTRCSTKLPLLTPQHWT